MADKKIKLVALFGAAASGKDTILKWIERNYPDKVSKIVSCTTRPPRSNEIEGQDYYFLTEDQFLFKGRNGEMLETTKFREWLYGTPKNELNKEKINVGVFNIKGIQQILKDSNIEVLAICIVANETVRIDRYKKRENNVDLNELFRRCKADQIDIQGIDFKYETWENNIKYTNAFEKDIAWEKEFERTVLAKW